MVKKRKRKQVFESDHESEGSAEDTVQASSSSAGVSKRRAVEVLLLSDHRRALTLPEKIDEILAYFAEVNQIFALFDESDHVTTQDIERLNEKATDIQQTLAYIQELLRHTDLNVDLDASESKRYEFRLLQYRLAISEAAKSRALHKSRIRELEQQLAAAKDLINSQESDEWQHSLGAVSSEGIANPFMLEQLEKESLLQQVASLKAENADLRLQNAALTARTTQLSEQLTAKQNENAEMHTRTSATRITLQRHIAQLWHTVNNLHINWQEFLAGKQLSGSAADINSSIALLHGDCRRKFELLCNAYTQRDQPVPQVYLFASRAMASLQESAGAVPEQAAETTNTPTTPSFGAG